MRDCCPANQFSGCCEPGQCKSKAKDLGRFTKTETVPLFTPSARGTVLVATCIAVIGVLVWAPGHINENYAEQDRDRQEVTAQWTR
jgi:hypothetical protein